MYKELSLSYPMYNEGILNKFNHFNLVKYEALFYNENEMKQIHMTDNI